MLKGEGGEVFGVTQGIQIRCSCSINARVPLYSFQVISRAREVLKQYQQYCCYLWTGEQDLPLNKKHRLGGSCHVSSPWPTRKDEISFDLRNPS